LGAQAHRRAEVRDVFLLGQQVDDRMRCRRIELAGVRAGEAADVPGELDDGGLQPEADAEERHASLAREPHSVDLALDAADTEAAGDQDRVHAGERRGRRVAAEIVGRDPVDPDVGAVDEAAVAERLHHG
jgi:hypothetical protein